MVNNFGRLILITYLYTMQKKLTYTQVIQLQKQFGFDTTQRNINTGWVWKSEGSNGRYAMSLLESGACMLPLVDQYDAYGNTVPSRKKLKAGTKGTFKNSQEFWQKVQDGKILIENED